MTTGQVITTFAGAFLFPFIIRLAWGKMVEIWGTLGGLVAAALIVGNCWTLNHGVGFIHQSGEAWVDMAWAAGAGLFAASVFAGDNFKKGFVNLLYSCGGGVFAGFVISCLK